MSMTFKDSAGREYDLKISLAAAMKLEADFGINLRDHFSGQLYEQITDSTAKLLNVVAVLAAKSFELHGLTVQQFADALDGDAVAAMQAALQAAIVDFSPPVARPAMLKIREKLDRVASLTGQRLISNAEELTDEKVIQMLDAEIAKAQRDFSERRPVSPDSAGS